jgi:DNA polymerase III alpha subunit (gram-positive type)
VEYHVELHTKSKYSADFESTIDIEALLWNALENKEDGIAIVDKDSILAFPEIEKIYNKLCQDEKAFNKFKVCYGAQLTTIINGLEEEIVLLVKKQIGKDNIYKIMSMYLSDYNKKIPFEELIKYREGLLIGLMLNEENKNIDLSVFDYLEINKPIDISEIRKDNLIIYSNIPNAFLPGDLLALEIIYTKRRIKRKAENRLYLDTEEALENFNDKEIVIDNSNKIFNEIEKITITDKDFYTNTVDNFNDFENLVRNSFKKKFKNPSEKNIKRLDEELSLIKEQNYTYLYLLLIQITNFYKEQNEYYQITHYINNSLVAYVLGITDIEPFNLPYELFFSETPRIKIKTSPKFYREKILPLIKEKYNDRFIKCNISRNLKNSFILRYIKIYEKKNNITLSSGQKDYICDLLRDMPEYEQNANSFFCIIPDNMNITDFSPYQINKALDIKETCFDYRTYKDNLIIIDFILNEDIELINKLINKTNTKVNSYTDSKVLNLFRNTESFKIKFNILNRETGLSNINSFDDLKMEYTLRNKNLLSIDKLTSIIIGDNSIFIDDFYMKLKNAGLDDLNIFLVINNLGNLSESMYVKASSISRVRIAYQEMFYKLYYPKEFYQTLLDTIKYDEIDSDIFNNDIEKIKMRYYELSDYNKLLNSNESEEFKLLEIIIELYERNIEFKISNKHVEVTI